MISERVYFLSGCYISIISNSIKVTSLLQNISTFYTLLYLALAYFFPDRWVLSFHP